MIFQVILVQMIFFAGLVLVLRKILLSSSYNETQRLQQLSEENAHKTQELAAKISDAENEYRNRMAKAEVEVQEMKAAAKREGEEMKEAMIAKGKEEGDRIVNQAMSTRDEIRAEIESQMGERSAALACNIFEKVLSSPEQQLVHDGLLKNVFQDLSNMDKDRIQSMDFGAGDALGASVRTAHSLSALQKDTLEKVLSSKLDKKVAVEENVDKKVVAGIVISIGSFVIDGSLSERFRKAMETLK